MSNMDNERIASLEAKMDLLLKSFDEVRKSLSDNYVPRGELEVRFSKVETRADKQDIRLDKLESAPQKWLSTFIGISGVLIALAALFL